MKTLVLIALLVLAIGDARADWKNVQAGQEKDVVLQAIGAPLIMSRSRSGAQESWTYDRGGYVLFENGRVRYWRASQEVVARNAVRTGQKKAAGGSEAAPKRR